MESVVVPMDEDPSDIEMSSEKDEKCKKRGNTQKFMIEYSQQWPCLRKSDLSDGHAYCMICAADITINHGGRNDCKRHCETKKHENNAKKQKGNKSLLTCFNQKEISSAINAEAFFSRFLVEHNIPLSAADHAGPLFRKMFPDSAIAKKYGSGRSKTTSIIRSMAEVKKKRTVEIMQKSAFSLATDASNDANDKKMYPLLVSYFDEEDGKIKTTLLSLLESSDATGQAIYKMINEELLRLKISWNRCVSFSSDNAANMTGKNKGLAAFISNDSPHVKFMGCCCHLLHRALQKASKGAIPVDIEFFVIQIYYYLDKSSKRKHELVAYQQLCNEKVHKILKHVNTRWLSLETSLGRIIEQWEPLKLFFNPEDDNISDRSMQYISIKEMFLDPQTKLYAFFLSNIIPLFNNVNKSLQQEKPCIHILKETLCSLYFNLIARFVTPAAVEKSESILSLNYKKAKNQKLNEDIVIGAKTRQYLNDSELSPEEKEQFFSCVKNFFCSACDYILEKFPLKDEYLEHASVANVKDKAKKKFESIRYFLKKYPNVFEGIDHDEIEIEFASYQIEKFPSDILDCERIDETWSKISLFEDAEGKKKYTELPKVMLGILTVPHSNATTERIFSIIRKNQTEFRSSLGLESLESLLIEKINMEVCYRKTFSDDELKIAKSARYMYTSQNN